MKVPQHDDSLINIVIIDPSALAIPPQEGNGE